MKKILPKILACLFVFIAAFGFSIKAFASEYTVQFSGTSYNGYSIIRSGPSTSYSRLGTISPNTCLNFIGYEDNGTSVVDVWTNKPDKRWFKFKFNGTNGWIASALVYGNPPPQQTSVNTQSAQNSVNLNVPLYLQNKSPIVNITGINQGCTLASSSMVYDYNNANKSYNNTALLRSWWTSVGMNWSSAKMKVLVNPESINNFNNTGLQTIYSNLNSGKPVILYLTNGPIPHAVVVYGYQNINNSSKDITRDKFLIRDPLNKYTKLDQLLSNSSYVNQNTKYRIFGYSK